MASSKEIVLEKIASFCDLSDKKIGRLEGYCRLLLKWNQSFNLVGKTTEKDIWQRHILDSAQLLKFIPEDKITITDFGAGAGFPAMVLAILDKNKIVHAIESNGKKTRFMREVSRLTGAKLEVHNQRIEHLDPWKSDIITARAFAPLSRLLEYIYPFCEKESLCILPKGAKIHKELEEAQKSWQFNHKLHNSTLNKANETSGFILEINEVRAK